MADICTDNRFELIEKYKKELIESTNIESSQDEMAVLDNLLFRLWQMGWLDRLEEPERKKGKWIDDAETFYKAVNEKGGGVNEDTPYFVDDIACSECLSLFSVIDNCTEKFNYCPNCGADMRGEGHE